VHQRRQLLGHHRRVGQQVHDLLSPRHQDLEQRVGVEDELVDLLAAFGKYAGDVAGALERSPRFLLRLLRVRDNRVSASKAGPILGAIWSSVAESVSNDSFSAAVLVPAVSDDKSLTASVNE